MIELWQWLTGVVVSILILLIGTVAKIMWGRISEIEKRLGSSIHDTEKRIEQTIDRSECERVHRAVDGSLSEIKAEIKGGMSSLHRRLDEYFRGSR